MIISWGLLKKPPHPQNFYTVLSCKKGPKNFYTEYFSLNRKSDTSNFSFNRNIKSRFLSLPFFLVKERKTLFFGTPSPAAGGGIRDDGGLCSGRKGRAHFLRDRLFGHRQAFYFLFSPNFLERKFGSKNFCTLYFYLKRNIKYRFLLLLFFLAKEKKMALTGRGGAGYR